MEIVLDKEERISILKERLAKTEESAKRYYNFAEAAAICGDSGDEMLYRSKYYALYDEAEKIKEAIEEESK